MLRSDFTLSRALASLLCGLCGIALTMTLTPEADASERLFGVGFSRSSTADPMGGRMQYSLWYR